MINKGRTICVFALVAILLSVAVYLGFTYRPSQARERPSVVYFYSGT
jgi:hypothetical protein